MYLVYYTKGLEIEEYEEINIFVTKKRSIAEEYVSKFNDLKDKIRRMYSIACADGTADDENNNWVWHRYYGIMNINSASYVKIELR